MTICTTPNTNKVGASGKSGYLPFRSRSDAEGAESDPLLSERSRTNFTGETITVTTHNIASLKVKMWQRNPQHFVVLNILLSLRLPALVVEWKIAWSKHRTTYYFTTLNRQYTTQWKREYPVEQRQRNTTFGIPVQCSPNEQRAEKLVSWAPACQTNSPCRVRKKKESKQIDPRIATTGA